MIEFDWEKTCRPLWKKFYDGAQGDPEWPGRFAINDFNNALFKPFWDEKRKFRPDLPEIFVPHPDSTIRYSYL